MKIADTWNTGAAAIAKARKHWRGDTGPEAVRCHLSLYNLDSSLRSSANDDLMGTGMPAHMRLGIARERGKEIIGCLEWRDDIANDGSILPVDRFGKREPAFPHSPTDIAAEILRLAEVYQVDIIQAGNEVFTWPAKPTLAEYEALLDILLTDGRLPVIADYHPNMAPEIVEALHGVEINPALTIASDNVSISLAAVPLRHIFPSPKDSDQAVVDSIRRGADLVLEQGGQPLCLEAILGRGISLWTKKGEVRFAAMMEAFRGSGCTYAPVWWGGYPNLRPEGTWTASGWPVYDGLMLYGPDGKPSRSAKWLREWQSGEQPPVDPPEPPPVDELPASIVTAKLDLDLQEELVRLAEIGAEVEAGPPGPLDPPEPEPPVVVEVDRLVGWCELWSEDLKDNVGVGRTYPQRWWRVDTLRNGHFGPRATLEAVQAEAERAWTE